jgi:enoyl-[acyl-carrier protein] reductase/trans-2-enoyl-CoA reductase (NAD+)
MHQLLVCFLKPPSEGKTASQVVIILQLSKKRLMKLVYMQKYQWRCFSNEVKKQTFRPYKKDLGQVSLIIYSLASPCSDHQILVPLHRSKTYWRRFTNKTVDFHSGKVSEISIQPCTDEDIENTVAVMGGEDWSMWIDSLWKIYWLQEQ